MTETSPWTPQPNLQSTQQPPERPNSKRPIIVWDLVISILVLVGGVLVLGVLSVFSLFLPMASDPCGSVTCNEGQITTGFLVALVAPAAIFLIAIILTVVRLVLRRVGFWIALVGLALALAGWGAGVALVAGAVPGMH